MSNRLILIFIGTLYALGSVALFGGFWLNEGIGNELISLAASCGAGVFVLGGVLFCRRTV